MFWYCSYFDMCITHDSPSLLLLLSRVDLTPTSNLQDNPNCIHHLKTKVSSIYSSTWFSDIQYHISITLYLTYFHQLCPVIMPICSTSLVIDSIRTSRSLWILRICEGRCEPYRDIDDNIYIPSLRFHGAWNAWVVRLCLIGIFDAVVCVRPLLWNGLLVELFRIKEDRNHWRSLDQI